MLTVQVYATATLIFILPKPHFDIISVTMKCKIVFALFLCDHINKLRKNEIPDVG